MSRVFFLGAGASCAAGYPITSELVAGIVNSVLTKPSRYQRLLKYFQEIYSIDETKLGQLSDYWSRRSQAESSSEILSTDYDTIRGVPDVTEFLSTLDVLIDENVRLGTYIKNSGRPKLLHARELDRIKQKAIEALCDAFETLDQTRSSRGLVGVTTKFVNQTSDNDFIITTNWDLLLDKALQNHKGQTMPYHCGTDCIVVDIAGNPKRFAQNQSKRASLLKLHGSFNWLYCQRCTRLYVNPLVYLARIPHDKALTTRPAGKCDCGMSLSTILVTPTYVKKYRNRHLANIWAASLQSLIESKEWIFIGYSFPPDDLQIRVLLLKALIVRKQTMSDSPAVTVVIKEVQGEIARRYRVMFPNAKFIQGFENYLNV